RRRLGLIKRLSKGKRVGRDPQICVGGWRHGNQPFIFIYKEGIAGFTNFDVGDQGCNSVQLEVHRGNAAEVSSRVKDRNTSGNYEAVLSGVQIRVGPNGRV